MFEDGEYTSPRPISESGVEPKVTEVAYAGNDPGTLLEMHTKRYSPEYPEGIVMPLGPLAPE